MTFNKPSSALAVSPFSTANICTSNSKTPTLNKRTSAPVLEPPMQPAMIADKCPRCATRKTNPFEYFVGLITSSPITSVAAAFFIIYIMLCRIVYMIVAVEDEASALIGCLFGIPFALAIIGGSGWALGHRLRSYSPFVKYFASSLPLLYHIGWAIAVARMDTRPVDVVMICLMPVPLSCMLIAVVFIIVAEEMQRKKRRAKRASTQYAGM